jgi:hypothetical protein
MFSTYSALSFQVTLLGVLTSQMLGDILAHFPDQLSGIEVARRNYMISMFTRHNDESTLRKNFERIDNEVCCAACMP